MGYAPPDDRVPTRHKLGFGMGAIAYGVKDNGFSVFLLIFYNQVVGLDARSVGAVILAALIIDAFVDPVIGVLSDRTASRWGRRLPWIYASAVPMALGWWLLWHPPVGAAPATALAWLFGCAIMVRVSLSMNEVPSMALGPELTRDYHERTLLTRWRFVLAWAAGLAMLMLACGVFVPPGATGARARDGYGVFAWLGAAIMLASTIGSAWSLHRRVGHRSPHTIAHTSMKHTLAMIGQTYREPAFFWLMAALMAATISQSLTFAMTNYFLDYVWRFALSDKLLYSGPLGAGVAIAFVAVGLLGRRFDKRAMGAVGMIGAALCGIAPYAARLAGLYPDAGAAGHVGILLTALMVATGFGVVTAIVMPSMLGDLVEAAQARTGRREEGLFGAGFWFVLKASTGVGIFVSGIILQLADFPARAVPGAVAGETLDGLTIGWMIGVVLCAIAGAFAFSRFPFGRAEHDARLVTLGRAHPAMTAAHGGAMLPHDQRLGA